MTDEREPVGMECPGCGQPPAIGFAEQAFCGNTETCHVVAWNPTKTLEENFAEWNEIDLGGL